MQATRRLFEYVADNSTYPATTRFGLFWFEGTLTGAYHRAEELLREGEVLRGITALDAEQTELALATEDVEG